MKYGEYAEISKILTKKMKLSNETIYSNRGYFRVICIVGVLIRTGSQVEVTYLLLYGTTGW